MITNLHYNYKHYYRLFCLSCYSKRLADANEPPCELGYDLYFNLNYRVNICKTNNL